MRPETITHRCSTSVGVTMFSGHQADESKIINLADQAMYRAKKNADATAPLSLGRMTPFFPPA
jgi:GGDEF domain-containing protein